MNSGHTRQASMRATTRVISLVVFLLGAAVSAQPQFGSAGVTLIAETVADKIIESGERIMVSLALKNVGDQAASNVMATVRAGADISAPSPQAQSYGLLAPWGPAVAREFEFTANAPSNSSSFVSLDLADSGRYLGTVTFRFHIGPYITVAMNSAPLAIDDIDKAAPYPSEIVVSNTPGGIIDISVTLSNLSHTFPDDMDILLVSPSGDSVLLMSDACGTSDLESVTLTFTDRVAAVLPNQGLPISLTVRPTNYVTGDPFPAPAPAGLHGGTMSAFNGKTPNGIWRLFIVDDSSGDNGVLAGGWSLNIITLQRMSPPAAINAWGITTSNTMRLVATGLAGNSYTLETSAEGVRSETFVPLESFIMPASGTHALEFPLDPANRFFRLSSDF